MPRQTQLPDAEWYAALTLRERADAWARLGFPAAGEGFNAELADWRMGEWRAQRPFGADAAFTARLASIGVDEGGFRTLLGTPPSTLRDWCAGEEQEWMTSLRRILAADLAPLPALPISPGHMGMLEVFAPFVTDAQARLAAAVAQMVGAPDETPFARETAPLLLLGSLLSRVLTTVSRVLTLELHVARMQGLLQGETAEERFRAFVARLRQPEHLEALLRDYPVLARTLVRQADQWVETGAELLRRLHDDRERIAAELNGGAPLGQAVRVASGAGDVHCGGRAVAIVDFSSGLRVVYKPRSLAVDDAFHALLARVNRAGGCPELRILRTIDRGTHGWVEFARAEACATPEQVERYYERLGGLLAVLYAVDGQDMHMENVVAAGEHPVLVDLETLFHPLPEDALLLGLPAQGEPDPRRPEPAELLAASVLKMGLLPQRVWGEGEGAGVDLSAVGGAGNQAAPTRALRLENAGSDDMRFTRGQVMVEASQNRPATAESGFTPADHAEAMERGFAGVYRTLAEGRGELETEGLLAAFGPLPLRVIMRPTRVYGALQTEGSHPDFLRDAVELDRFLDKLWLGAEARPALAPLIPHETRALHAGDIPAFFAAPDSRDLISDAGAVIPGQFARGGLERVRERIAALSPADLERQRLLIRGAMATLVENPLVPPAGVAEGDAPASPSDDADGGPDAAELVRLAEGIGERLEATAIRGTRTAAWIGLTTQDGAFSVSGTTRYDLHGGLPGILVFLARLGEVTGSDRHDALARQAFAMLGDLLHDLEARVADVGGFSGLGGILPALAVVEARWPELPARALAERAVARIAALCDERRRCDVFGGLAGAAAGLVAYHAATGCEAALQAAVRCGDRLLALRDDGEGGGWAAEGGGFAFGAAGIAWSLLRLADAAGEERFRAPAREALEDAWREWEGAPPSPADGTWAYGAPGFALALAAAPGAGDGDGAVARAVEATLRGLPHAGHAPCNGTLGALDALLEVASLVSSTDVAARVRGETRALLDSVARDGWRCGVPLGVETPGLMNGLAGMGHGLLRLAHPERVPSLLDLGLHAASAARGTGAAALAEPALEVR